MALSSAGCLVTSVPEYEAPQQTPPFMIPATADPPISEILAFEKESTGKYAPITFSAQIISEDIGVDVEALFFLVPLTLPDEDVPVVDGDPGGILEAGTLDSEPRVLRKTWTPPNGDAAGCFTLFWVAAHQFDTQTDCPVSAFDPDSGETLDPPRDDSSRLAWKVILCNEQTECAAARLPECLVGEPRFQCDVANGGEAGS